MRFVRTNRGEVNTAHVVRASRVSRSDSDTIRLTLIDGSEHGVPAREWDRLQGSSAGIIPAAPGWALRTYEEGDPQEQQVPIPVIGWTMPHAEPVTPMGVGNHPTNYVLVAPDGSVHLPAGSQEWASVQAWAESVRGGEAQ